MRRYMHTEWGFEKRGDAPLFEKICLEGAQAGLSWATILAKREAYRKAFKGFDIEKCAAMTPAEEAKLLLPPPPGSDSSQSIVRNKAKVASVPKNARAVLALIREAKAAGGQKPEHGHLDAFFWGFVGGMPQLTDRKPGEKCPATNETSEAMSKALKQRGFSFVGPTICYSFMQACGLIVDHPKGSSQWNEAQQRLQGRKRKA